jgi:hypothetical protein
MSARSTVIRLSVVCLALSGAQASFAQPKGFVLDAGLGYTTAGGNVPQTIFASSQSFDVDVRSEGKVQDNVKFQPSVRYFGDRFRVEVDFRRNSFATTTSLAGFSTARSALAYTGPAYTGVDYTQFSTGFRYDVLDRPRFSLGIGTDVDYMHVEAASTLLDLTQARDQRTQTLPVATIGATFRDDSRKLFLDLKVGYGGLHFSTLGKLRAEAGYLFSSHGGVKLGWEGTRFLDTSVTRFSENGSSSSPEVKLLLSGVSGGVFFRF